MHTHVHLLATGLTLAALGTATAQAQIALVNPVPQQVTTEGKLSAAPTSWRIVADASRAKSFALQALSDGAVKSDAKARFVVTLGVKGDKAVKKYASRAPRHAEGYYLELSPKGAVVVGTDESGLYYGIETLVQSLAKGQLETATVTDWPDVSYRGTVEGFYGTPWSHAARLSQISFYGRNKMNVYIYGPKDDPYHRDRWREPYPADEARRIQELNEQARAHGVRFYWAIHPGVDIKWTDADRDKLVAKLEQMYDLGVRSFAVFFDDIWGEGAKADKQAQLLNYVDDHFVKAKHDVSPLILCPTEYNRAWANDEGGYLKTLGTQLNKGIEIMWTGNSVVHCIDKESMEWINQRIQRKAYIWWNFPVSDFVRDHILLGPAYGNGLDIAGDVSGFVSNPMEHAEASKIALYGIADYTWNMRAYDPDRDWDKAIRDLLPDNADALRTFALYNKDLGANGHRFRREEGDELKPVAEAALKGDMGALGELGRRVTQLKIAADVLLTDKSNPELIRELRPWLLQARNVADYGQSVIMLTVASGQAQPAYADSPTFGQLYQQARSLREQMFELENSSVRHALQPGIKVGTKVLMPTLNGLFTQAVKSYNAATGSALDTTAVYQPCRLTATVDQLANLPLNLRNNELAVAPSNEVINWPAGGALTLTLDHAVTLSRLTADLGADDVPARFRLEALVDGQWRTVPLSYAKSGQTALRAGSEIDGLRATALRLTNVSGAQQQVYFRQFAFGWQ